MKLELTINTDNDAFRDGNLGGQLAEILNELAYNIAQLACTDRRFTGSSRFTLQDSNGNTVGTAEHGGEE